MTCIRYSFTVLSFLLCTEIKLLSYFTLPHHHSAEWTSWKARWPIIGPRKQSRFLLPGPVGMVVGRSRIQHQFRRKRIKTWAHCWECEPLDRWHRPWCPTGDWVQCQTPFLFHTTDYWRMVQWEEFVFCSSSERIVMFGDPLYSLIN